MPTNSIGVPRTSMCDDRPTETLVIVRPRYDTAPMNDGAKVGSPAWSVLLVGGASGVGKTHVSRPLARRFDADLTAVDDIQAALERMTSPEQYPELHRWRLHPGDVVALDDEGMLAHTLANAAVVCEALEPIIGEHLESSVPVVLDGDFLLPSLAAKATFDDVPADGRLQGLFLYDDERRLLENFRLREGEEQARRARASWRYGEYLRSECERLGVPCLSATPWETLLDRALGMIEGRE